MFFDQKISDTTFVSFDIETSGSYIFESSICEFAGVKWRNNQIIDTYQTLIKPPQKMSNFIIGIHGITNEMVESAPIISEKITGIHKFLSEGIPVAHHSPFDMGFLALEFEKSGLEFPKYPVLCSSLISRKLITDSVNHKLQTLIEHLGLERGTAHRALDDAKACMGVMLKCFEKIGPDKPLNDVLKIQEKEILWKNFSIDDLKNNNIGMQLVKAIEGNYAINVVYSTDPNSTHVRLISPKGIARNPDGDFVHAFCVKDQKFKKYYLRKIQKII